jgi:putative transcriptional regulator
MSMRSLAPAFLLSMPQLVDRNFSRTVVLLCKHSDEGAFGLVVNRPLVTTGRVIVDLDPPLTPDHDLQVWIGGPVEPQRSWILVGEEPGAETESASDDPTTGDPALGVRIASGLYLSTSPDLLRRLLEPEPPARARLMVGYSGWGPGQLEAELEEESWLVEPAEGVDLFPGPADDLFGSVLRRKGGTYRVLALMPVDPSSN